LASGSTLGAGAEIGVVLTGIDDELAAFEPELLTGIPFVAMGVMFPGR